MRAVMAPALFERVVQFREAVRDLHAAHEQFETVGEVGIVGPPLGEGGDLDRIVDHVGRLNEAFLGEVSKERLDGLAVRKRLVGRGCYALLAAGRHEGFRGDDPFELRRIFDLGHGHGFRQLL